MTTTLISLRIELISTVHLECQIVLISYILVEEGNNFRGFHLITLIPQDKDLWWGLHQPPNMSIPVIESRTGRWPFPFYNGLFLGSPDFIDLVRGTESNS